MTPDERERDLLRALRGEESDRVERKPSLSQSKEIRQAICAFANDLPGYDKPGYVIVGQEDDGSLSGLSVDDEVLRKLSDIRGEGSIQPFPTVRVMKHELAGGEVAVMEVQPAAAPPARFRGTVWVRIGSSLHRAGPEEERRLSERRRARDLGWELRPVPTTGLGDLHRDSVEDYFSQALAPQVLEQNRRGLEQQLSSLRLITLDEPARLTNLGVLVGAKDPLAFLPGAYVQFLRLAGTGLESPIQHQRQIHGNLGEMLSELDRVLTAQISVATDFTSSTREIRSPDYPLTALQQLARNAVLHRNYEGTNTPVRISWFEDRIEILSPGGPYGEVNRWNFGQPGVTSYRNPYLAEAMSHLGFVQKFGFGIPTARHALQENDNPPPEFDVKENFLLVVIRRRP
jgi:ATP-dependent DNA helicase RecG